MVETPRLPGSVNPGRDDCVAGQYLRTEEGLTPNHARLEPDRLPVSEETDPLAIRLRVSITPEKPVELRTHLRPRFHDCDLPTFLFREAKRRIDAHPAAPYDHHVPRLTSTPCFASIVSK